VCVCVCTYDLDLDSMTSIIDIHLEMYRRTKKIKFLGQGFQKLKPKCDRLTQTDAIEYITAFTAGKNLLYY